jgi:DNA-binding CsgD family transcriptional regulator
VQDIIVKERVVAGPNAGTLHLSPRMTEVLSLVRQGYNNGSIAGALFLKRKSVENYINILYQHFEMSKYTDFHPRVALALHLDDPTKLARAVASFDFMGYTWCHGDLTHQSQGLSTSLKIRPE